MLKAIHIASAGVWLGGLVAIVVLLVVGPHVAANRERSGLDLGAHVVHDDVLLWAFVITLLTGLAFATLTPWGMIRHHWITVKWLLAIGLFVTTLWFQNPTLAIVAGLSSAGVEEIGELSYADARWAGIAFALAQLAVVGAIFVVSATKPWGQRNRDLPRKLVIGLAVGGIATGAVFGVFNHVRLSQIRALPIDDVAASGRRDGTWRGAVHDCGIPYAVDVTIADGRITRIFCTRAGDNRYTELGTAVLARIVAAQSPDVDAVTGATTTSHCLSRAVGRALRDAPAR
jgi:uncharacterized protein with FMN-binding domain